VAVPGSVASTGTTPIPVIVVVVVVVVAVVVAVAGAVEGADAHAGVKGSCVTSTGWGSTLLSMAKTRTGTRSSTLVKSRH
jgi:hypothetical protein